MMRYNLAFCGFVLVISILFAINCKQCSPTNGEPPPEQPAKLYVANSGDGTVSVIDVSQNVVTKTIPVGQKPVAIAVSSEWKCAYVANFLSKSISVIDTETDVVKTTIALPGHPVYIVAGSDSMAYLIVDQDTTITNDAYIGGLRHAQAVFADSLYFPGACSCLRSLAYSQSGLLYTAANMDIVCDHGGGSRPFTVNTQTEKIISHNTFGSSRIHKLSPDEKFLYIVGDNFWGEEELIYTFDTETRSLILDRQDIEVESSLTMITLSPDGQEAYIGDATTNHIPVLNLSSPFTITDSLAVNSPAYDMVVTADGKFIYASHPIGNQVSVINIKTKQVEKEIAVGFLPKAMALRP